MSPPGPGNPAVPFLYAHFDKTVLLFQNRQLFSHGDQPQDGSSIIPLYVYRGEPSEYHSMAAPAALLDALVVMIGAKLGSRSRESLDRLYHLKEHYRLEIPR